jgi:hypothetical protein
MNAVRLLAAAVLLVVVAAAPAQRSTELDPRTFEVGQTGKLPAQSDRFFFLEVGQILGDKEMVVVPLARAGGGPRPILFGNRFVVRGVSTKGLVDGKTVRLEGEYRVSGTKKVGQSTLFVVEPSQNPDGVLRREDERFAALKREIAEREAAAAKAKAKADAERRAKEAAARAEAAAAAKVALARQYLDLGKKDVAATKLKEVLRDYPKTKAAEDARALLK